MKDGKIHISEFVLAKIKGKIKGFSGHPEITDSTLKSIINRIDDPSKVIEDLRSNKKYLFINNDPLHQIVIEVNRSR